MDKYSFLNSAHTSFFAELYDRYQNSPDSIEPSWRAFFQGFDFGSERIAEDITLYFSENGKSAPIDGKSTVIPETLKKEFQVIRLIDTYRIHGHLFTKTNPVRERRKHSTALDLSNFGLSSKDLDTVFEAGSMIGAGAASLRKIVAHLDRIYCNTIGIEYMHLRNPEHVQWIQNWLNINDNHPEFTPAEKKNILRKLNEAVVFENFLHTKYVGQKRFSLEGGESLIPALDTIIEKAIEGGVKEFVVGMAHRGRLNVLTNIFGKSPKDIFSEFDGKDYEASIFDGDVKYHLGWTSQRESNSGRSAHMNIVPNPSHLESVNAVVEGIVRAKQDSGHKDNITEVMPILIHGDAALAGQGVVYEVVQMSQLEGYHTGGTIHIVVNNQIGFTTNSLDARSSTYCTDVGKITLSPVLHVNANDTEAVVHAAMFALEYRMRYKSDVFLDLLGYRKYGHNEGDEPKFTQPLLYKAIARQKNPRDLYADKLIAGGIVTKDDIQQLEAAYKAKLEKDLTDSRKTDKTCITPFMEDAWKGFEPVAEDAMLAHIDTTYPLNKLDALAQHITTLPEGKQFFRKLERLVKERHSRYFIKDQLDWAMGELLAYASLLEEGYNVRLTGQDVERGTFSHRHAVIKTETDEEEVVLLNALEDHQNGTFYVYNSLLSEYAVMGFDYGYAMASPNTLTLWEAQFGDFSNGAQIIIDQYLSSAEDKWKQQNGLVLLLPHGYEGQGAEHSSARMERYLQLCAKDNMYIANVTTPANFFHLLRQQMKAKFRKPLVIFTPKSLLRHPKVISTKTEMTQGSFQKVIDDADAVVSKIKTLVLCNGKFYYDLLKERETQQREDVALVRIEQLFPLPTEAIQDVLAKYDKADDIVWAQEEPRNMGAWGYLLLHLEEAKQFRVASRRFYGATAAGSAVRFKRRHDQVIAHVFDKTMSKQTIA